MAPTKTWLSAVGLCLISSAAANRLGVKTFPELQSHSEANLAKFTKPSPRVHVGRVDGVSRRQDEGCYGTCASCFGDNYRECANDDSLCWDPNDPTTGCDTYVPDFEDFPDFDDIDLPGGTEWCTSGETCAECFGDDYELCPGSTMICWSPNDPTTGCDGVEEDPLPDDFDDYPGETEWCTSGETCADCFGTGYELCPGSTIMCWNPDLPSTSAGCDDMDGGVDEDMGDDANDDDDDDTFPTESEDPVPTLPSSSPSATAEETPEETPEATSGSDDDEDDGPRSGGGDVDDVTGDSSDDDDDDSAATRVSGMSILPVIVGAVGVAALL